MDKSSFIKDTPYDVFISYSSKDKNLTNALCHFLEEQKIRCWIAPRDILPGQEYAEAIVQAMQNVKIFILICSKQSLQSKWVHKETNLAVSYEKIIIPFKIENCDIEGTGMQLYLNDRHWIDAVPKPSESFGDLVMALKALLGGIRWESVHKQPTDEKITVLNSSVENQEMAPSTLSESHNKEKSYIFNEQKDQVFSKQQILEI